LLINNYSRKEFIDGRVLRFPTIVVRPGSPNKVASTFASSIIREPLQGQPVVCPVSPEIRMWILSPRQTINAFIHAAEPPASVWGYSRAVSLPGLSVSIQEMVDALRQIAGSEVFERITWQPDPSIQNIVSGWPVDFAPKWALSMGFVGDDSVQEIIWTFIDDELGDKPLPFVV
jgi:nucleoside-diphosphate-sugar epimerase